MASGCVNPYDSRMPRNVPTSAAPTLWPISAAGPSIAPIVMTTPSTAATMPRPGSASATLLSVAAGLRLFVMTDLEVLVHQRLEVVRRRCRR